MSVLNYIREQKRRLEERHWGETFLCLGGEEPIEIVDVNKVIEQATMRSALEILREIDGLRGLNVRERERASAMA